jgi:hypothetical protein
MSFPSSIGRLAAECQSFERAGEFRALLLQLHLNVESKSINFLTLMVYVGHSVNVKVGRLKMEQ